MDDAKLVVAVVELDAHRAAPPETAAC